MVKAMTAIGKKLPVDEQLHLCWELRRRQPPDRPNTIWRLRYSRPHKRAGKPTRWLTITEYLFTSPEVNDKIDWIESNDCKLLSVDQYEKRNYS